jgi:hypothetical protein
MVMRAIMTVWRHGLDHRLQGVARTILGRSGRPVMGMFGIDTNGIDRPIDADAASDLDYCLDGIFAVEN